MQLLSTHIVDYRAVAGPMVTNETSFDAHGCPVAVCEISRHFIKGRPRYTQRRAYTTRPNYWRTVIRPIGLPLSAIAEPWLVRSGKSSNRRMRLSLIYLYTKLIINPSKIKEKVPH